MSALVRLAERAASHPFFLAHHLALLRREHGQTIAQQAEALGLDLEAWGKLALCRMPATWEDVERIAEAVGLGPGDLAEGLLLDLLG